MIFLFVNTGSIYNYVDDNYVSVQHEELGLKWFSDNAMEANPNKFQGILFNRGHNVSSMQLQVNDNDISFVSSINALGICIDDKLNFNDHVDRICSKAACQVSALQRLTSVLGFPSRKAIYNSFISTYFNYCPTVWFFTTRASIQKVEHIQERALRFVLRDSSSEYNTLLYKANVDSFRLHSLKKMVIEIFKIVKEFAPVIYQPYLKCLKVHMICVIKADLFSQKWTQHHMDWNRLSTMDPIFGIYFRCILNRLCLFLNLRNFSQHGRGLPANVHYAPYCSELMIFYWSVFSFCAPIRVCRIMF